MGKPAMNIVGGNRLESLFESIDQIGPCSSLETPQDGLDLRPGQFNRIEVRRVRWQVDQVGTARADQLIQTRYLMSGKIVHEQNITGLEVREDALFDIA